MECNLTERVSLLIDGELSHEEVSEIKSHIAACAICKQAQTDFLRLRREISAYECLQDPGRRQRALNRIVSPGSTPFWKKRLALPVPILALVCTVVVVFAGWVVLRMSRSQPPTEVRPAIGADIAAQTHTPRDAFDLS